MANQFPCDYCRAVITPTDDSALLVSIHRRVDADEWGDDLGTLTTGGRQDVLTG